MATDVDHGDHPVPTSGGVRAVNLLIRVGHMAWLIALPAYVVLVLVLGVPRSPELGPFETPVHIFLLFVGLVGGLIALRSVPVGGVVLVFGAVCFGVMAALRYPPPVAFAAVFPFFVPGVAYVLAWVIGAAPRMMTAAAVTMAFLAAGGGFAAATVHNHYHGAAHPQSDLDPLPDSAVEWVWSGGVTEGDAVVVAKVDAGVAARLAVATSPDFAAAEHVGPSTADGDGVVRFAVSGLDPATDYHYAVEVAGELDLVRTGSFRTPATGPMSFSVAAGACARSSTNGKVFEAIHDARPLLFLAAGDIHSANIVEDDPDLFREALDESLTRPAPSQLYRSTPTVYVFDDHDFGGNDADSTSPSRPAVLEVYRQYVPSYPLVDDPGAAIYHAFTMGRVRFIVTDTRSDRSPKGDLDGPGKTMLGTEQKQWFKDELLAAKSRYPVIVWVNPDPWIGEAGAGEDSWAGYATERAELADFIADNGISGIVMVSGDAHMVAIDDGTNSDYSSGGGAGFPVLHAAALDRPGGVKGGPYSEGAYPGAGQWALITVTDDGGDTIEVVLSGRDWTGTEIVELTVTMPVAVGLP
jgi:phosphodiesterase/alkaline phosphatase D-like protein